MLLFECLPALEVHFVWILVINFSFNMCKIFTTIIPICHSEDLAS